MEGAKNQSDVARLRALIEQEIQLMEQMSHSFSSGFAKHAFISARMEHLGGHHETLANLIGEEKSMGIICELLDTVVAPQL
jgi:hypothetical protein